MTKKHSLWARLFFVIKEDADPELDLGWAMMAVCFVIAMTIWVLASFGVAKVTIAMWSFMAGVFASLLIAGIPIAKARLLASTRLPADMANSVSSAPVQPDLWKDDERGEFKDREPV